MLKNKRGDHFERKFLNALTDSFILKLQTPSSHLSWFEFLSKIMNKFDTWYSKRIIDWSFRSALLLKEWETERDRGKNESQKLFVRERVKWEFACLGLSKSDSKIIFLIDRGRKMEGERESKHEESENDLSLKRSFTSCKNFSLKRWAQSQDRGQQQQGGRKKCVWVQQRRFSVKKVSPNCIFTNIFYRFLHTLPPNEIMNQNRNFVEDVISENDFKSIELKSSKQ